MVAGRRVSIGVMDERLDCRALQLACIFRFTLSA